MLTEANVKRLKKFKSRLRHDVAVILAFIVCITLYLSNFLNV